MQDRNISTKTLLTETFRLLRQFLVLVAFVGVACLILYLWLGTAKLLAAFFASFFALTFFSAPLASSAVRLKRGLRLFTRSGGRTLLFSFVWGSIVVAMFIATLQLWHGMEATLLNYISAMAAAGIFCAATATIPSSRFAA
jgi:hypothetical protein